MPQAGKGGAPLAYRLLSFDDLWLEGAIAEPSFKVLQDLRTIGIQLPEWW
jgi:hypothetical protein